MPDMDRREFLLATFGGVGLLGAVNAVGAGRAWPRRIRPPPLTTAGSVASA